jgi:hypothetical protein
VKIKFKSPSPKVLQTLVVVVFIIVASISYSGYKDRKPYTSNSEVSEKQLVVKIETEKNTLDSDGDLLQDWEEVLWGTDPNNPDTDGDGTKDGVETSLNRDPLVVGPDDEIKSSINSSSLNLPNNTIATDSFTQDFGIDIFTEIIKNSQDPNSTLNEDQVAQSLESAANQSLKIENLYSKDNLIIQKNTTRDQLENYSNNLFLILAEEYSKIQDIDVNSNSSVNSEMLNFYTNTHTRLSNIPVPEVMSGVHLSYINNIYKGVKYYEIILDEQQDPLLAYYAIPKFRESFENANRSFEQITTYLENNGIIFSDNSNYENNE